MDSSRRASRYDLFKLIIAIVLAILFLFLIWKRPVGAPLIQTAAATSTPLPATGTSSPSPSPDVSTSATQPLEVTPTLSPVTSSPQATATSLASVDPETPTSSPTQTQPPAPTNTLEVTDTALPTLTATLTVESTATQSPGEASVTDACETVTSRSRLETGMSATILRRLNFRSSPGIRNNWILTNIPGTKAEVVGGPECLPHLWGAYLWWQIELPDGRIGWSAEGSLYGTFYFMEPGE